MVRTPIDSLEQLLADGKVRATGLAQSPEDIGEYVVITTPAGPVLLKDIATVVMSTKRPTSQVRYTNQEHAGTDSVSLVVTKQSDANTLDTADALRKAVATMKRTLPRGVDVTITNDTSRFVVYAVDAVKKDLFLAIIITAVVLFLFLFDLRTAAICCAAIPISLLAALVTAQQFGITLNTMTLGGLAIALGEVVDDAVIGVENIARRLRENKRRRDPRPAARVVLEATFEVRSAV